MPTNTRMSQDSTLAQTDPTERTPSPEEEFVLAGLRDAEEQHGDHIDFIEYCNVWEDEDWSWYNDWLTKELDPKDLVTNAELYEMPLVQQRMQLYKTVRRGAYLPLDCHLQVYHSIPLFTDQSGEEYRFSCGQSVETISLPCVICPEIERDSKRTVAQLFQVRYGTDIPESQGKIPPPKRVIGIGYLHVKTQTRDVPGIETTDYNVVIDVDHEDMPVWILAPRRQLRSRLKGSRYECPKEALPIFGGAMEIENGSLDKYYDAACILSSARRIGAEPSDPAAPNYQESCDLVRRSCATIDPRIIRLPAKTLLEYTTPEVLAAVENFARGSHFIAMR